jgi:hypothetical protein
VGVAYGELRPAFLSAKSANIFVRFRRKKINKLKGGHQVYNPLLSGSEGYALKFRFFIF